MSNEEFWKKDVTYLRKLYLLFCSNRSDYILNTEFPLEDVHSFRDEFGKPLSYIHSGQRDNLRYRIMRNCADKVLDIMKSRAGVTKLIAIRPEKPKKSELFECYSRLFEEANLLRSYRDADLCDFLDGYVELNGVAI